MFELVLERLVCEEQLHIFINMKYLRLLLFNLGIEGDLEAIISRKCMIFISFYNHLIDFLSQVHIPKIFNEFS